MRWDWEAAAEKLMAQDDTLAEKPWHFADGPPPSVAPSGTSSPRPDAKETQVDAMPAVSPHTLLHATSPKAATEGNAQTAQEEPSVVAIQMWRIALVGGVLVVVVIIGSLWMLRRAG